jgi:hypothetical protein
MTGVFTNMRARAIYFGLGGICTLSVGMLVLLLYPGKPSIKYIVTLNSPTDVLSEQNAIDVGKQILNIHEGSRNWMPMRESGVGTRIFVSGEHTTTHGWVAFTTGYKDRIVIMSLENGAVVGKVVGPKNGRLGWEIVKE